MAREWRAKVGCEGRRFFLRFVRGFPISFVGRLRPRQRKSPPSPVSSPPSSWGVTSQRWFKMDRRVASQVVQNWQESGGPRSGVKEDVFSCVSWGDFQFSRGAPAPSSTEIAPLSRFQASLIMGSHLAKVIQKGQESGGPGGSKLAREWRAKVGCEGRRFFLRFVRGFPISFVGRLRPRQRKSPPSPVSRPPSSWGVTSQRWSSRRQRGKMESIF